MNRTLESCSYHDFRSLLLLLTRKVMTNPGYISESLLETTHTHTLSLSLSLSLSETTLSPREDIPLHFKLLSCSCVRRATYRGHTLLHHVLPLR